MDHALVQPTVANFVPPSYSEAWAMAANQLRMEMRAGEYRSYVEALQPVSFKEGLFRIGAKNEGARLWVESHLRSTIIRLLSGILREPVKVSFIVVRNGPTVVGGGPTGAVEGDYAAENELTAENDPQDDSTAIHLEPPVLDAPPTNGKNGTRKKKSTPGVESEEPSVPPSPRKVKLQRAYGEKRAAVIQPERTLYVTKYFFEKWLPLLKHSAFGVILAARTLCYWNVDTGERRDEIETDMQTIADQASVSLRTVKDVLNTPLVKEYFLRYNIRRVTTPNGVRTAGITLKVRMDDPLTPEDQAKHNLPEDERWYPPEFDDED